VRRERLAALAVELLCVALAAAVIVPFLMICINSLKDTRESALFGLSLPTRWVFANYAKVLAQSGVLRSFANSLGLCAAVVLVDNVCAALAAFVIQRRRGALRHVYYLFFLGLIAPVAIVPTIRLMMDLHVHNTYTGIVLYYAATVLPFSVFVLTGFMKSLPREIDEAALIEGCTYLRLFFQIIVPLIVSALVTVTIVVTTAVWDDFMGPFYLISDSRKWTIMIKIFSFMSMYQTEWGLVFAFMVLVMAPVLTVYLLLQRAIIDGLTAGSLKG
jgi:raffinose/stachyose/melibiose transport system permease protein